MLQTKLYHQHVHTATDNCNTLSPVQPQQSSCTDPKMISDSQRLKIPDEEAVDDEKVLASFKSLAISQHVIPNDEIKLDKERTNVNNAWNLGRVLDEDVCGILLYMDGEEGAIALVENPGLKPLIITTGPDKTGYELILIKTGQRATLSHGASGRCIR